MYDAIIVGARAAGSATGLLLARLGRSVLVVERAHFPSDTWSTHFITAPGTELLRRWGAVEPLKQRGVPFFDSIVLNLPEVSLNSKDMFGPSDVCSPRRTDLDLTLSEMASAAGAEVRFGVTVTDLARDELGRITGVMLRDGDGNTSTETTPVVIGADGRTSIVAKTVDAPYRDRHAIHGTGVFAYFDELDCPYPEVTIRDGTFMFIFPTKARSACVGAAGNIRFDAEVRADPEAWFNKYMGLAPAWQERLRTATRDGRWRLGEFPEGYFRHAAGAGWALVGDAAALKDPLPGHGITDSFLGAELLAQAVHQGLDDDMDTSLAKYDEALWRQLEPVYSGTVAIATYDKPASEMAGDVGGLQGLVVAEKETVLAGGPFLDAL